MTFRFGTTCLGALTGAILLVAPVNLPAWAQAPQDSTFWGSGATPPANGGQQSPGGSGGSGDAGSAGGANVAVNLTGAPLVGAALDKALREAQPIDLKPSANPTVELSRAVAVATAQSTPPPSIMPGSLPTIAVTPDKSPLLKAMSANRAANAELAPAAGGDISAMNYGSLSYNSGYNYTDRSVFADSYANYPQSAIGHLVFTLPTISGRTGGTFRCSAALIQPSIIVTAGHCAHWGGTGSFATGLVTSAMFVPNCMGCATLAPGSQFRPYGFATINAVSVSFGWFSTGGLNAGVDIAVYGLNYRDGTSTPLGSYTGTLAFCTQFCLQNLWYLTAYGYPGNYSTGDWLYEGQAMVLSSGYDYTFGTGAEGGASGGPFISNVGAIVSNTGSGNGDGSANLGQYSARNVVFATRSWGYNDPAYKIGGSTALTGTGADNLGFKAMYNAVCSAVRTAQSAASCALIP